MPITRRRRANPPDEPENTNHLAQNAEQNGDSSQSSQPPSAAQASEPPVETEQTPASSTPIAPTTNHAEGAAQQPFTSAPTNGDRAERRDRGDQQDNAPTIESGRRTVRGELFRRPPQPPQSLQPTPPIAPAATSNHLQAPTHEMSLPLGNLLHLAYNPGYTGADEARSTLLQKLAHESKAGGRARCWNCGALAIVYDRWNTRSKTFGEVGVAYCEICGVWSVM